MNVYACTNFRGRYPVGTCALVVAESAVVAAEQLTQALIEAGLEQVRRMTAADMLEVPCTEPSVRILLDGDY